MHRSSTQRFSRCLEEKHQKLRSAQLDWCLSRLWCIHTMGYYIKPRIMFVIRFLKCGGNVPAISLRGKRRLPIMYIVQPQRVRVKMGEIQLFPCFRVIPLPWLYWIKNSWNTTCSWWEAKWWRNMQGSVPTIAPPAAPASNHGDPQHAASHSLLGGVSYPKVSRGWSRKLNEKSLDIDTNRCGLRKPGE